MALVVHISTSLRGDAMPIDGCAEVHLKTGIANRTTLHRDTTVTLVYSCMCVAVCTVCMEHS